MRMIVLKTVKVTHQSINDDSFQDDCQSKLCFLHVAHSVYKCSNLLILDGGVGGRGWSQSLDRSLSSSPHTQLLASKKKQTLLSTKKKKKKVCGKNRFS